MRLVLASLIIVVCGCFPGDRDCPARIYIGWNVEPSSFCVDQVRLTVDGQAHTYPCSAWDINMDNRWTTRTGQVRFELLVGGRVLYTEDRPLRAEPSYPDDTGGCVDPSVVFPVECNVNGCRKVICDLNGCDW